MMAPFVPLQNHTVAHCFPGGKRPPPSPDRPAETPTAIVSHEAAP